MLFWFHGSDLDICLTFLMFYKSYTDGKSFKSCLLVDMLDKIKMMYKTTVFYLTSDGNKRVNLIKLTLFSNSSQIISLLRPPHVPLWVQAVITLFMLHLNV